MDGTLLKCVAAAADADKSQHLTAAAAAQVRVNKKMDPFLIHHKEEEEEKEEHFFFF